MRLRGKVNPENAALPRLNTSRRAHKFRPIEVSVHGIAGYARVREKRDSSRRGQLSAHGPERTFAAQQRLGIRRAQVALPDFPPA